MAGQKESRFLPIAVFFIFPLQQHFTGNFLKNCLILCAKQARPIASLSFG
jgi:hypothetical protein